MENSTILVIVYPEQKIADQVMDELERLHVNGGIEMEDACAVTKDEDGKVKIHQIHNLPLVAATGGAVLGTILGMVFLVPYIGAVIGAAAGALGGMLADVGIDDDFIRTLGTEINPQNSALFLQLKNPELSSIIPALAAHGAKVLHTSFTQPEEDQLMLMFDAAQKRFLPAEYHPPQ